MRCIRLLDRLPAATFPAHWRRLGLALPLATACTAPAFEPSLDFRIVAVAGDAQVAPGGAEFTVPLTVEVRNPDGNFEMGVRVRFATVPGRRHGGALLDTVAVTGGDGRASVRARAGASGDTLAVIATIAALPRLSARLWAVARDGPAISRVSPAEVRPGDTLTINGSGFDEGALVVRVGGAPAAPIGLTTANGVRVVVPPCADSGAVPVQVSVGRAAAAPGSVTYRAQRSRVALPVYGFTTVSAGRVGDCLELAGGGATYLVTAQLASVPDGAFVPESLQLGVGAVTGTGLALGQGALARAPAPDGAFGLGALLRPAGGEPVAAVFDRRRRELERRLASSAGSGAMPAPGGRAAAYGGDTAAPDLGTVRKFSVVSNTDGSSFSEVDGVLAFAGAHILGYRDRSMPPLSFDFTSLLQLMDSHLWDAAASAFGGVPDVDGNGRIIVLFTPVVNRLVRAQDCLLRGYVTGFFYPPDLFVRTPNSNQGEVFYALAPDAAGAYSCAHSTRQVVQQVQATFLHEMEHLISFNEHVLARGGVPEETWLAEALGRMAEELGSRYFESRYPPPFGRSSSVQLFPDSSSPFIGPLLLNAYVYLNASLEHSVTAYIGAGSLEDQGAGWLFLRWVADQRGDDAIRRMVQTRLTGVANLEAATGEGFASLFGDFGLALFADSLPGLPRGVVPSRLRYQGRALRQLMAREGTVQNFPNPFPLATYLAAPGTALRAAIPPGTMLHAIVPTGAGDAAVRLSLTRRGLTALPTALGAQVGILRLPP
ncbi:MAG: IPT/TIG domain-containing protein [Gemmatimonadota bacterium]|nr:IPT/TIG domain-containing protein [Gemmatimonadota bacterium]